MPRPLKSLSRGTGGCLGPC